MAWYRPWLRETVIMPMPINFAARVFWWVYWGLASRWFRRFSLGRLSLVEAERRAAICLLVEATHTNTLEVERTIRDRALR